MTHVLRRSVLLALVSTVLAGGGCDHATSGEPDPVVGTVEVTPLRANLETGQTVQLSARVLDDQGNLMAREPAWSSDDDAVSSVSSTGLVTAIALGTTTVRARVDGVAGSAVIEVVPPSEAEVATVEVTPSAPSIRVGQSLTLVATPRDATGAVLANRTVGWSSADPGVVSVDTNGAVTGQAAGTAVITAVVEGVEGTAVVTVTEPQPVEGDVDIDLSQSFQTMIGWEGVAQIGQVECSEFDVFKDEVVDRLVNELGINRVRAEIRIGMENTVNYWQFFPDPPTGDYAYIPVNDNDDPFVADLSRFFMDEIDNTVVNVVEPMRQLLAARGEDLYVNLCLVDFNTVSFHKEQPQEYAELIEVVFEHLEATYGWTPDALEIILEPDLQGSWQPEQIANVLAATAPRLAASGWTPDFIAPSVENMALAAPWAAIIAQNPQAMQYLTDLSYHRYQGQSEANAQAIVERASELGLRTGMLEHIGDSQDNNLENLWEDLTVINNSAWQQFALAFCGGGGQDGTYYDWVNGQLQLRERNRPFLQIFPFVRHGAVRYGTTVRDGTLRALAFRNAEGGWADGRWAVIVQTEGPKTFTVGQLPAGTYEVTYTSAGATAQRLGQVTVEAGGLATVQMPEAGIVTLFGG